MHSTTLSLPTPADFDYRQTAGSHGWYMLAPFSHDPQSWTLWRVQQLADGALVRLEIREGAAAVEVGVSSAAALKPAQQEEIHALVRRCFSIDWDLSAFYAALDGRPGYEWIAAQRAGRILVCPTVWEDLVKTLFTTNTTWSQTIAMTARFCELGAPWPGGGRAFPTPQQVAALTPEALHEQVRAGYRSAYLHELASRITSGELDVESWYTDEISSEALYQAVRGLKGFGDYAAGTMLRLLGHFDRVAIDTACRAAYKQLTGSETAPDRDIQAYYEPFGRWRGLAAWMDIMRD